MPVYQFTAFGYLSFNVRVFDTCFKRYTLNFFVASEQFFNLDNATTKIALVVRNHYLILDIYDPKLMNKGKTEQAQVYVGMKVRQWDESKDIDLTNMNGIYIYNDTNPKYNINDTYRHINR